jgi:hypothetical protein
LRPGLSALTYICDVHNRISKLANGTIGDHFETIRTEDKVDGTDFVTILAPTQRINDEFALKVAWEEDQAQLAHQVRIAKQWMHDHGMRGVIATRQYLTEQAIQDLNFNSNERHMQLDRAVHPAAAEQRGVGRVDNRVHGLLGDIALYHCDLRTNIRTFSSVGSAFACSARNSGTAAIFSSVSPHSESPSAGAGRAPPGSRSPGPG